MSWPSGFFDRFLFIVAVIVAVLTAFDWLVGEDGRKKLRERVGDFWTTLQYQSLDEPYVNGLQTLRTKLTRVYGEKLLSARFILVAFAVNVLFVALSIVGLLLWTDVGAWTPSESYIRIGIRVGLTMLAFSLALGWYPIASFFWVVRRLSSGASAWRAFYLPLFVLLNAILFLIVAVLIVLVAFVVLTNEPETPESVGFREIGPFLGFTLGIMVPISALPFFISLLLVVVLACLKLLRPLLQPLLSLLLQRLYESKQGVLTQIALILGALSKAAQELLKHVG